MTGRLTNTDAVAILNNRFGATSMPTATSTHYIGLSTTQPLSDGTGVTEPVGNGYARQAIANNTTNWPTIAAPTRTKVNGTSIVFPTATGTGWGTVGWFVLYDAVTGGVCRAYGDLAAPVTIAAGETRAFPAGSLSIVMPGN